MSKRRTQLIALSVGAGAIFTLGLSPFDIWPLAVLSVAALAALLRHRSPSEGLLIGWLYGVGFFGSGVSWVYVSIHVYGQAPPPLALLLTIIFCGGLALLTGLLGYLYARFEPAKSQLQILWFTGLWVLFEWIRSWLLTGFPWLYLGYVSLDTMIAGWAPVAGVFGVSLLLSGLAAVLANDYVQRPLSQWWRSLATLSVILLGGGLLGTVEWTRDQNDSISVAMFQPNISLNEHWDRRNTQRIMETYASNAQAQSPLVDLIVWPEGAMPFFKDQATNYLNGIDSIAEQNGATIITGLPTRNAGSRYNSIVALGNGDGQYDKQKLVPFGEFVPLESMLRGLISFFDLPMSNFSRGEGGYQSLLVNGTPLAPMICYEVVYPDFVAAGSRQANALITISKDAWFGSSIGPHQHFQMARFRALEMGKPLLRGTNNGITAFIDHRGSVVSKLPQFERGVLTGSVSTRDGLTPFARAGSLPTLILVAILLFISLIARRDHLGSG